MREGSYGVEPADHGSDDACYADRENPDLVPNPGHRVVSKGEAEGKLVGGHPRTFCLPFGKEFMPDPEATIFLLGRDKKSGRSEAASVASITNTRA